jgi:isopentenyldiphosphate isomerase
MSENILIPVVDTNDKVLGYKKRGEIALGDIYRISTLWVMNDQNEVLLAQRSFLKTKDPGLFSTAVAGTIEQGETYESNILKETEEEIGVTGITPHFIKKYLYQGKSSFFCTIFSAIINQPISSFRRQQEEVESLVWMPFSELVIDSEKTQADMSRVSRISFRM